MKSEVLGTATQPRYSDEKLKIFEGIILEKIKQAEEIIKITEAQLEEGNGINVSYKPDEGEELEIGSRIAAQETIGRQRKFIRDLKRALVRIEAKTYGICMITGELIDERRLMFVPHATLSIAVKNKLNKN